MRWFAPIGVAAATAAVLTVIFGSNGGSAERSLPSTTPAALIMAVETSDVKGFAGTVSSHLSLGIPDLPDLGAPAEGESFASLLRGTHTLRIWYGGPAQQRIALLGSTDERDVFRDGTDLWQWDSDDRSAMRTAVPAPAYDVGTAALLGRTSPLDIADAALASVEPSTDVRVEKGDTVADRATYQLVLTPHSTDTKIGEVRISVDGQTKVPLAVRVFARGTAAPSIDVAFTTIEFGAQPDRTFRFSPPAGATVRTATQAPAALASAPSGSGEARRVVGSGWGAVLDVRAAPSLGTAVRGPSVLSSATPVSGRWGHGQLLDSDLLSALVTSDGRIFVGAVAPDRLFAVAARN